MCSIWHSTITIIGPELQAFRVDDSYCNCNIAALYMVRHVFQSGRLLSRLCTAVHSPTIHLHQPDLSRQFFTVLVVLYHYRQEEQHTHSFCYCTVASIRIKTFHDARFIEAASPFSGAHMASMFALYFLMFFQAQTISQPTSEQHSWQ